MDIMIIIWAVVIAAALLVEFLTCDFITLWFAASGAVCLILAACNVSVDLQVILFILIAIALLASLRPITKKLIKTDSVPTNADANIGKVTKLTADVKEGRGEIVINSVTWTAVCDEALKTGDKVVITEMAGNKYIVKKEEKN